MKKILLQALLFAAMLSGAHAQKAPSEPENAYLDSLYLYLHQHPEISFHEKETGKRMADELRKAGFEVAENVGGYGVVGVLRNGKGKTLLVRTDTDALPIIEDTGAPYASRVMTKDDAGKDVGAMHACGHDIHMTVWTGAARWLAANRKAWHGTLIFIAQPAEERGSGAVKMLEDGLYTRFPQPDIALALHCNAALAAGKVGYCPNYALANVDMVDITVYGEGGHGAYPHLTKDPIVLAARIITDLQTLVSRENNPLDPAVVTVGSIHGGSKGNIIPSEVKMELTLRSYTDEMRNSLIERIRRTCNGAAMGYGLPESKYPKVEVRDEFVPALFNDPQLCTQMAALFAKTLGEENVSPLAPVMGAEDFSRYGRTTPKVPIFLYWLGTVPPANLAAIKNGTAKLPSLHSAQYLPDYQPSIRTGVQTMTAAVVELMSK